MNLRAVTLIEDRLKKGSELLCEHGLSIYIETNGVKILFDTGQSGKFIKNAEKLGIDLGDLQYVILSHGHYDHTGGFKELVSAAGNPFQLIVGSDFFHDRYKIVGDNHIFIGNNFDKEYVHSHNIDIKYISEDIYPITEHIAVISNFNRTASADAINGKFFKKQNDTCIRDEFTDEIALTVNMKAGVIVFLGCSHPGIVNILSTIEKRLGKNVCGVIGGTHLIEADDQMINETETFFKGKTNIRLLALSHCTGEKAAEIFGREFTKQFMHNNTGDEINLFEKTKGSTEK